MELDSQEPSQNALAATFPGPPLFWRDFTAGNNARLSQLRAEAATANGTLQDGADASKLQLPAKDLPPELVHLQPPPEPADGKWRIFGDQYTLDDKLPSLEEQGIDRLVSPNDERDKHGKHIDRAFELKRLAKSLLLNFLELIGTLGFAPQEGPEKVKDLWTLLINFHHILNEYRPHQARESAIAMMQSHLDQTRAETAAVRAEIDKAKQVLEGLGSVEVPAGPPPALGADHTDADLGPEARRVARKTREDEIWTAADGVFGQGL